MGKENVTAKRVARKRLGVRLSASQLEYIYKSEHKLGDKVQRVALYICPHKESVTNDPSEHQWRKAREVPFLRLIPASGDFFFL